MNSKPFKKVLAAVFAATMVFSSVPVTAEAADLINDGKTIIELNASAMPEGDITSSKIVDGVLTLTASSERRYTVEVEEGKRASSGLNFTQYLKSNGATNDQGRAIGFWAPEPGKVTVYMLSADSSASGRTLALYNEDLGVYVDGQSQKAATEAGKGGVIKPQTFDIAEGNAYYSLRCSDDIKLYYFKVEFKGDEATTEAGASWNKVNDPVENSIPVTNEERLDEMDVDVEVDRQGTVAEMFGPIHDGVAAINGNIADSGGYALDIAKRQRYETDTGQQCYETDTGQQCYEADIGLATKL